MENKTNLPSFNFLANQRAFVIKIGQYISHEVIHYRNDNDKKVLKTEEEINELDRIGLAYDFYENYVYEHYLEGGIPKSDFIDLIAYYLDMRIIQSYLKWKHGGNSPSSIDPNEYNHNLIRHFQNEKDVYNKRT